MKPDAKKLLLLTGFVLLVFAAAWGWLPQQDPDAYFDFADQRVWLGIPNFGDVISNLPFALVGVVGLLKVRRWRQADPGSPLLPYAVLLSLAMIWVAFGSGYFHWFRTRESLVWDRIPMTFIFAGLLTLLIRDRVALTGAGWLYGALAVAGVVTAWGAHYGYRDLRPYIAMQFGTILMILVLAVGFKGARLPRSGLVWMLVLYGVSKFLETSDAAVFQALRQVSGHTLKHLFAALAIFAFVHGWPSGCPARPVEAAKTP
jgi:hypothetical protein